MGIPHIIFHWHPKQCNRAAFFWLLPIVMISAASAAEPVRDIPNDGWVDIYFESIDRLTTRADLVSLRTAIPKSDHLEARFWFGFGGGGLSGFVVRRESGEWSGLELWQDAHRKKLDKNPLKPRETWETAWRALEEKRLTTLPDFSTLPPSNYQVMDGSCAVVEVVAAGKYRTYEFLGV